MTMAKPISNIEHHPNCNCCERQASFVQSAQNPSRFGSILSTPLPKKLISDNASKSSRRTSSGINIKRSLQHGNGTNSESFLEDTFDKLGSRDDITIDLATEIVEEVANGAILQAKESRMKGTSRDKESLLQECSSLNNASTDQLYHLKLHKVHHESVNLEQRRIESIIKELEMANGLEAPRTGGHSRLKSKLLGLKCRQQEYFYLLTTLQNDLKTLKKDPQVSLTNEADIERDTFALEVRRLQKVIWRLRKLYHKVCKENNEVISLRENIAKFTFKLTNAQISLKDKQTMIDQMKMDIDKAKFDAFEAQKLAHNSLYKVEELGSHFIVLQDILTSEKQIGQNLHKEASTLIEQTRNAKKENADRDMGAKIAIMNAIAIDEATRESTLEKRGKKSKLKGSPNTGSNVEDSTSMDSNGMDSEGEKDSTYSTKSKDGRREKGGKGGGRREGRGNDDTNSMKGKGGKGGEGGDSDGTNSTKGKGGRRGERGDSDGSNSTSSEGGKGRKGRFGDASIFESSKGGKIGKGGKLGEVKNNNGTLDGAKEAYLREIGLATTILVEGAYASRSSSPRDNASPTNGDHFEYNVVRNAFQENVSNSEDYLLNAIDELQYGSKKQPNSESRNAREARLAAELEALKKSSSPQTWVQNPTIHLDDQVLLPNKYAVDIQDSKTNVHIISPHKTTKSLAKKKQKEVEETRRQAQIEEEQKKKAKQDEDEAKKRTYEEAPNKATSLKLDTKGGKDIAKTSQKEAVGKASSNKKPEFFDDKMQGVIKQNIVEVIGHLETISESIQQKATASGTAESTAKDVLEKLERPH